MFRIPRTKRGLTAYVLSIAFLTFSIFLTSNTTPIKHNVLSPSPSPMVLSASTEDTKVTSVVTKVIDGDTFKIASGETVRLIGINAPEISNGSRKNECFSIKAKEYLQNLVLNKEVTLEKDISNTDSFGRILRYAYLKDLFINEDLVKNGYAQAINYQPDTKYETTLQKAQSNAFLSQTGIWKECF